MSEIIDEEIESEEELTDEEILKAEIVAMVENIGSEGWFMHSNKAISMLIQGVDSFIGRDSVTGADYLDAEYVFLFIDSSMDITKLKLSRDEVFLTREELLATI